MQETKGIRKDKGRVAASLRETCWPTKVQIRTRDRHLRYTNGPIYPVNDSKVGRIDRCVWRKRNVDSIKAKSSLINQCGAEGMCFVESQDLTTRSTSVAKPWNGVSLKCRLPSEILLMGVIKVKSIFLRNVVTDVDCELIDVYGRGRRTDEA